MFLKSKELKPGIQYPTETEKYAAQKEISPQKDDYQLKASKMFKSIKGSNQCLKGHCTPIKETKNYHGKYVNY